MLYKNYSKILRLEINFVLKYIEENVLNRFANEYNYKRSLIEYVHYIRHTCISLTLHNATTKNIINHIANYIHAITRVTAARFFGRRATTRAAENNSPRERFRRRELAYDSYNFLGSCLTK